MNKLFVDYDIALAMKSIGFDEPCIKGFYNESEIYTTVNTPVDFNNKKQVGELVSSPLFQQCFSWFREKYNYHSVINRYPSGVFSFTVDYLSDYEDTYEVIPWGSKSYSYEETQLECLKKLIEICK